MTPWLVALRGRDGWWVQREPFAALIEATEVDMLHERVVAAERERDTLAQRHDAVEDRVRAIEEGRT